MPFPTRMAMSDRGGSQGELSDARVNPCWFAATHRETRLLDATAASESRRRYHTCDVVRAWRLRLLVGYSPARSRIARRV